MPLPTDLVSQIEDEQEAIEERMEDLLIFPSEDVLRKSLPLIESHFSNETAAMRQGAFAREDFVLQKDGQNEIMDIAWAALKSRPVEVAASCCKTS